MTSQIKTWALGAPTGIGRWAQGTNPPTDMSSGEVAVVYTPATDKPLPSPIKIAADGKSVIPIGAAEAAALATLLSEAECLAAADARAGALRQQQITTTPGQADIYRRKQAEVDKMSTLGGTLAAILVALNAMTPAARAATYPLLTTEMQVMGHANLSQAYAYVSAAIAACNDRLNAIEKTRRQTKIAIRSAAALAAKNAALNAAAWPA